ncbi:hypothetical protein AB4799_004376 [Yersinia enterocolitica]
MDITKSREEFEAYIRKNFQYPTLEMEPEDGPCTGEYVDTMREDQFLQWDAAWKASRESIEVELPKNICGTGLIQDDDLPYYGGFDDGVKALASRLRTAGIRIKGESDGTK